MSDHGNGRPRLSPESMRERLVLQARADVDRILADYGVTLADIVFCRRSDPFAVALTAKVPMFGPQDPRLQVVTAEIGRAAEEQRAKGEAATLSYLVDVHVPGGPGRLHVDLRPVGPPRRY